MEKFRDLDTEQSIAKNKLVYRQSWGDKFGVIQGYFICGILLLYTVFFHPATGVIKDEPFILYFLVPFLFLSSIYIGYRQFTQKSLLKQATNYKTEKAGDMLLAYAHEKDYSTYKIGKDCVIWEDSIMFSAHDDKKYTVFIIRDYCIWFCVIKEIKGSNRPVLFSHLFLERDMKELFANTNS